MKVVCVTEFFSGLLCTKGAVPGRICFSDSDTTMPPFLGSNRQTKVMMRCSPPIASQGTQKL